MYRIVIVEDEAIIRKGLVYTIDWASLNCVVIGEADNGDSGLNVILEKRPEIVLTDICMKPCDGLTMLEKASQCYEFVSIILSGYSEFDYAQKAMRLNSIDYLLKPIDESKLRITIEKAKATLERIKYAHCWKNAHSDSTIEEIGPATIPKMIDNYYSRKALEIIHKQYCERICLRSVAENLHVNESYLARKIKESTGMTFSDCLNKYRINRAIYLMQNTGMRIGEISDASGFAQYKQFSIMFRRYMGMSPSEYLHSKKK